MRSDKVISEDVLLRAKNLKLKKERITIAVNSLSVIIICGVLFMVSLGMPQENIVTKVHTESAYASLVYMGDQTGGYVLVGIGAFILGVIITLLCLHLKNKNGGK